MAGGAAAAFVQGIRQRGTMKALVTGANGHLGYNLCNTLLRQGHEVRASIRQTADEAKAAPLRALGDVELVGLNVRDASAFAKAVEGVDHLFHLAATFAFYTGSREKDAEMVRDSVQGAENALHAAARAGIEKVILTSSFVTLPPTKPGAPPVTEKDWLDDLRVPYYRAKVEGERAAWRLAEELGVKLVTVLPGTILGPGFHRRTGTIDFIEGVMLGTMRMGAPNANLPLVDVRDVVQAHILAAHKDVAGRFIVCNDHFPTMLELTRLMHAIDAAVPAAPRLIPDFAVGLAPFFDRLNARLLGSQRILTPELVAALKGKVFNASNARAKTELGWQAAIPLEQSLADTMATIRALRRKEGRRKMA
jgi:dihydroflavonol-4-reductase